MNVGRIVASVTIENAADLSQSLRCYALVDTGASHMVLPTAWKKRLGSFAAGTEIEVETATQEMVTAEICGPVRIQIAGFRPIFSEVAFVEMKLSHGEYEPLIGYIVLEQSQAAVDMLRHRLVPAKHLDLKTAILKTKSLPSKAHAIRNTFQGEPVRFLYSEPHEQEIER